MEFMSLDEIPWKDNHHQSSFLPNYQMVEIHFETMVSSDIVNTPRSLVLIHDVESEGNLSNIFKTILVDISVKNGVVKNIQMGQNCSSSEIESYTSLFREFRDVFTSRYEEMPRIDPSIVFHEIRTYPDAKLVC